LSEIANNKQKLFVHKNYAGDKSNSHILS